MTLSAAMLLVCSLPGSGEQQTDKGKSANASPANLAPNPSFEDGDDSPTGWQTEIVGEGTFDWKITPGRTDGHSLSISNILGGSSLRWTTKAFIPIDPEHDYEISVWYRNSTQTSTFAFLAVFWGAKRYGLESTGVWQMKPTLDWVHRTYLIHSEQIKTHFPGANRVKLSFGGSAKVTENGAVWIDDVSFKDVTPSR